MKKIITIILGIAALSFVACKKEAPVFNVEFDKTGMIGVGAYQNVKINYKIESSTGSAEVRVLSRPECAQSVSVNKNYSDPTGCTGYVSVRFGAPETIPDYKKQEYATLQLVASNLAGIEQTFTFNFEGEGYEDGHEDDPDARVFELTKDGGKVSIPYKTNTEVNITLSNDAKSWARVESDGTKALAEHGIVVECDPNTAYSRSASVTVTTVSGNIETVYTINQKGVSRDFSYVTTSNPIVAPEITGAGAEGMINWGDTADSFLWQSGVQHGYSDGEEKHTVTVATLHADGFAIPSLFGISEIDLTEFK